MNYPTLFEGCRKIAELSGNLRERENVTVSYMGQGFLLLQPAGAAHRTPDVLSNG